MFIHIHELQAYVNSRFREIEIRPMQIRSSKELSEDHGRLSELHDFLGFLQQKNQEQMTCLVKKIQDIERETTRIKVSFWKYLKNLIWPFSKKLEFGPDRTPMI